MVNTPFCVLKVFIQYVCRSAELMLSTVGDSSLNCLRFEFLPAAKPRRSMDYVWLPPPGKIKSMGVFRGQGGMLT